ncbi:MAG: hypothetical protein ABL967_00570 [Bryobacteraceae bacterium]
MNLLPTQLGAEPKKVGILIGLLVLGGVAYYVNQDSGIPEQAQVSAPAAGTPAPRPLPTAPSAVGGARAIDALTPMPSGRAPRRGETSIQDFKPTLKLTEGTDVSRIDPELHLDLIAKLRGIDMEGGGRSLFDFGAPPKPKTPPVPAVAPVRPTNPNPIALTPQPDAPPPAAVKPPPPQIPLKFYGYVNGARGGSRQALFLEGDDIYVAGENDTIHNRYKVLRIGINSAVVEDTSNKNQQTLPLVEELAG